MEFNEKNINPEVLKQMLKGTHSSQNKIQVTVGDYNPTITRKVGDTWTDSEGVLWEQKEGYTARVESEWRKDVRDQLKSFSNCPKETCTCIAPSRLDEKMRIFHRMCFDCVLKMEHKLKLEGKYKEYERERVKNNVLAWIQEAEKDKNSIIEELAKSLEFVNSNGMVEKWSNNIDPEELRNKIENDFEKLKNDLLSKLEE